MLRHMTALIVALLLVAMATPEALAASGVYSAHTPLSGAGSDKLNNLRLAAQAIDGATVAVGESFSFNDTVGPREKRRGFRTAPNGRGVLVTGGGVAQAASTLYMTLLQMGDAVEIEPVKTYGARFTDDYVQNPSLAIITDYDAGIDLSFTSLTDDLSIDMWMDEDDLWCVVTVGGNGSLSAQGKGSSGLSFLDDDRYADYEATPYFFEPIPEEDDRFEADPIYGDDYPVKDEAFTVTVDSHEDSSPLKPLGSSIIHCGSDPDVIHNITLAADCLNDTMLISDDVFSFNDVVGPRTKKYGYRRAVNGRGAKVTGGGVAQVASALWLAIEDLDDIEILEKSTYGKRYNQRYVADSADAILTDYASGRDFRFRYTGDTRLTIYAYVDDGFLYCDVIED